jgi:hypothetical protein
MNLAALLRYMQFYAHIAHNTLGGPTFFEDHEFLAELYAGYEDDYDSVVERMIGLEEECDLIEIHKAASSGLKAPKSFEAAFKEILNCEEELCKAIESLVKGSSQGTMNLLAGIADKSEMRMFKLKQRLK